MLKKRLNEVSRQRVRAGRLLQKGEKPAEVAHAAGVAWQTVYVWRKVLDEGGIDALRDMAAPGRPARLQAWQLEELARALLNKPSVYGFETELWTLKRVGALINRRYGVKFGLTNIWLILGARALARKSPSGAPSSVMMAARHLAGAKKKAQREGCEIVFIDESGLSERPTRVRTWAPKGHMPIIEFHFNRSHVSAIAALTRTSVMFRLHESSINKKEIVEFLKALKAQIARPLLVIWDGLKSHRSVLVRQYLGSLGGLIQIAFLPPYAPDLNPIHRT